MPPPRDPTQTQQKPHSQALNLLGVTPTPYSRIGSRILKLSSLLTPGSSKISPPSRTSPHPQALKPSKRGTQGGLTPPPPELPTDCHTPSNMFHLQSPVLALRLKNCYAVLTLLPAHPHTLQAWGPPQPFPKLLLLLSTMAQPSRVLPHPWPLFSRTLGASEPPALFSPRTLHTHLYSTPPTPLWHLKL